jgi:D-glucosaminate-6-phosphate ammonia-lyase
LGDSRDARRHHARRAARSGTTVTVVGDKYEGAPAVELALDEDALGLTGRELAKRLQDGEPSVHANHARVRDGIVVFGPTCMKPGDAAIVIERVRAELGAHSRGG